MHELSVAVSLVRQAESAARESAGGRRVTALVVEVGELSGAVPELLRAAFPMAAVGTRLEGARLRLKRVPLGFRCRNCGRSFGKGPAGCPACRSADVELISGRELNLVALEVEEEA